MSEFEPCPFPGCGIELEHHDHHEYNYYRHPYSAICPLSNVKIHLHETNKIDLWNTRAEHPDTERLEWLERLAIGRPVEIERQFGKLYINGNGGKETLRAAIDDIKTVNP